MPIVGVYCIGSDEEASKMSDTRPDNAETGYKCSRCGGEFGSHGSDTVSCPFCGMLCEETSCRVIGFSNEEY